ncbi:hypothetical protein A6R68_18542, partial [Neotoma lepida]
MKLKEIDRTAMQAWSPAQNHPIYLATGTSAQQLDATFSTSASLEIFELDLSDPSLDMKSCATFSSAHRYHKLIWGPHKMDSKGDVSGVLIAGGENGNIILYDPSKIIAGDKEVVIAQKDKHTGPVRALDVNIFQTNLVASGANESEIYIWDLNNFATPMTPGAKTQHILASASPSGRATVWDLRKNEPIIKVSDHSNRMHCSGLAWHPDVATQMVLASEDDRLPVIQMWDLRFASSPLRVLENHARGILAIAWSMADPELLLSCGKDAKILCSNPNTGEVLYELPTNTQWCFDIQWCPRNPAVLSAASFDGRISVYSIMGGSIDGLRQKQVDKLSSSFGNLDPFGTGQPLPPLQIPQQSAQHSIVLPLKKPPKWIRRPVGASFSFGGKLVTFENVKVQPQQGAEQQQQRPQHVFISQVVTEKDFLSRSEQLQQVVQSQGFISYCQRKIDASQTEFEKNVWSFLKVNFEEDSRGKYLELLGYRREDLGKKIALALNRVDGSDVALKDPDQAAQSDGEESPAAEGQLLGERIKEEKQESDFLPSARGTFNISVSGDIDGLITRALLTGNFESAVDLCLHDNRMADAIILAIAGGQELLAQTQKKYFEKSQSKITRDLIEKVVILRKAVQLTQAMDTNTVGALLAEKMSQYASLLAAQVVFFKPNIVQLRDRLCRAQGKPVPGQESSKSPYERQPLAKGRPGPSAGHPQMPRVQTQQYYPHGENPPPPGFIMHGNVNPNTAAPLPTSPGHLHGQLPSYPQPQPYQPAQQYPFGTGGSAAYRPQQPAAAPASNAYPSTPYIAPAASYSGQPQMYPAQPASSPTSNSAASFPPPPSSGASFQHGGPGAPPSSSAYALPPGTTGTPPAASELPASQRTGLRLEGVCLGLLCDEQKEREKREYCRHTPRKSSHPAYFRYLEVSSVVSLAQMPRSGVQTGFEGKCLLLSVLGPQNGWNDPPALNRVPKKKKTPENFKPPVPITSPIMNPCGDPQSQMLQQQPSAPGPLSSQASFPQPHLASGQPFHGVQQPLGHTGMPPSFSTLKPNTEGAPGAPIGNTIQHVQALPTEKITKKPIPDEHLILKTTHPFWREEVWGSPGSGPCLGSACALPPTPLLQTKRKLDDASKRLEFLYDKLREQTLSPTIINGLHSIARSIETRNYSEGLAVHTHIVSTSNFSETSAFMPVLKVVLSQARLYPHSHVTAAEQNPEA